MIYISNLPLERFTPSHMVHQEFYFDLFVVIKFPADAYNLPLIATHDMLGVALGWIRAQPPAITSWKEH